MSRARTTPGKKKTGIRKTASAPAASRRARPRASGSDSRESLRADHREQLDANEALRAANTELELAKEKLESLNLELNRVNRLLRVQVEEVTQAQAEVTHQSSFPILNPNPVLEMDFNGALVFANQAAREALGQGETISCFFPSNTDLVLEEARQGRLSSYREDIRVGARIFSIFVQVVPQFKTLRIYANDVTDMREAFNASRQSEARFRSVLDHSRDVIYRINLKTGRYEYMSPSCRAELNYDPEELMAMSNGEVLARVHPEDLPALKQTLGKLAETGHVRADYRFRDKEGKYSWWSNYLVLINDETGQPAYRDGSVRNISAQKQVEAALRASEEQYRSLFNGMTEGFAIHEMLFNEHGEPCDYRFLDINPAFERLTGLQRADVVGKTHSEVLPNDSPRWVETYGRVVTTGEPLHFEEYSPELKRHYEVFAYSPAPRQFAVVFMDITERKRFDAIQTRLMADLQEGVIEKERQRGELEAVFTAHNDVVLIYDLAMRVQKSNPAFQAGYGFDPVGLSVQEIVREVDCRRQDGTPLKIEEQPTPLALSGKVAPGQVFLVRGSDGSERVVESTSRPLRLGRRITGAVTVWHDITERVLAETALRHSEERYRKLVEQSPVAVFVNRNNRIEYLNAAALELFGASTVKELLGKSPYDLFHASFHALLGERIRLLFEGHMVPLIHTAIHRVDGTLREVEAIATLFADTDGPAIQVILRDITERKKKEDELHRLNWILNALSDSSQALMHAQEESAYLEEVCRIVVEDCNHPMVWIGYAEPDGEKRIRPVAKSGFEDGYLETLKVTWADTEYGQGPTGTSIRTGKVQQCRNMLTDPKFSPWRAEAAKRGYAASVSLPLMFQGKAFGAICIYAQEPDAFANDEIKLFEKLADNLAYGIMAIRLRTAHAQSEEKFRTLAENSTDSITRLDLDGRHIYANPVTERILCTSVIGKTWREAGLPPEFLAAWEQIFQRVLQSGQGETCEDEFRSRSEAQTKHYACRIIPERDASGAVQSMLIIRTDITELKRLTSQLEQRVLEKSEELLQAHAELERTRRMADIGRLAATLAHEMRNPLAAIRMAAYNIERKAADPKLAKHLATITKKVIESDQIIQNLLNFSRIKQAHYEPVELRGLLEECLEIISQKYAEWRVRLEKHLGDAPGHLQADPTQLRMLFTNLLDNAYQALADKTGIIGISIGTLPGPLWSVSIRDSGSGIPDEYVEKIFDPFFTTKSKGTGLGLAVCREIVELHHGAISLRTKPGQGTEFIVELPRRQPREEAAAGARSGDELDPDLFI